MNLRKQRIKYLNGRSLFFSLPFNISLAIEQKRKKTKLNDLSSVFRQNVFKRIYSMTDSSLQSRDKIKVFFSFPSKMDGETTTCQISAIMIKKHGLAVIACHLKKNFPAPFFKKLKTKNHPKMVLFLKIILPILIIVVPQIIVYGQ